MQIDLKLVPLIKNVYRNHLKKTEDILVTNLPMSLKFLPTNIFIYKNVKMYYNNVIVKKIIVLAK